MPDLHIVQIADVIVNYSLRLKPGETLLIRAESVAEPLIKETYRAALKAGARVATQIGLPGMGKIFMDEANDDQINWISPLYKMAAEEFDAFLAIQADSNTREGTHFDPEKQAKLSKVNQPTRDLFMKRAAEGKLKWCVTLFPTNAHAQDADMALEDYTNFVFDACLPDKNDPIGFWKRIETSQNRLIEFLNTVKEIRLIAPDTDLRVNVEGRTWINCCGHENFPDGEVFTGPVETKTEGHVRFTYPAIHNAQEVINARLWFEKGRVVKATADKGEGFLNDMLNRDEGARVLGEFAIGTNPGIQQFTRNTLFDEKIKGTVHMAVGMSYPESGGVNQSQIHWDMVCDMRNGGKLYADGKLIYKEGAFTVNFDGEQ